MYPFPDTPMSQVHCVYNLFILVLIVFSFVLMAGMLLGENTSQIIYRVDVLICAVLFADFVRHLWRAQEG